MKYETLAAKNSSSLMIWDYDDTYTYLRDFYYKY